MSKSRSHFVHWKTPSATGMYYVLKQLKLCLISNCQICNDILKQTGFSSLMLYEKNLSNDSKVIWFLLASLIVFLIVVIAVIDTVVIVIPLLRKGAGISTMEKS